MVRADRAALVTRQDHSDFSASVTPVLYSRTFLAGGARPAWEALAAPIPSQSIITNAIVTGTFCRGNTDTTVKPTRAHQQPCCHFIGCSAPNPTHHTATKKMAQEFQKKMAQGYQKKMAQEYQKKMAQEYQLLIPHCQAKKPRKRSPACYSLGGSRKSSTAQHMLGLRKQNRATPVAGHKCSLLLSLSQRPGSHLPVSESWHLSALPPPS